MSIDNTNFFIYYGTDEGRIDEILEGLEGKYIKKAYQDMNYCKYDGKTVEVSQIINACETMPFFADKKMVVIYRATFLRNDGDKQEKKKLDEILEYAKSMPVYCILVICYVLENPREKVSNAIKFYKGSGEVVKVDKLKGIQLIKKVSDLFQVSEKKVDKVLVNLFCSRIDGSLLNIKNEIDKLCSYTLNRAIKKEDIMLMLPNKNDDDIFDLVDSIAQKKLERALELLNELLYKGELITIILSMIERQFKLLFIVKENSEAKISKAETCKKFILNEYIYDKLLIQCRKFSGEELAKNIYSCIICEKNIKSLSTEQKLELELLIVKAINI
ncbi:MAG TPA: DNA polymerase III subunit delta [Clostridiaceae bacterium]